LTDVDGSCPEGDEALDLRVTFGGAGAGARVEIEVDAVLDDLLVRARHEADADGCVVGWADDDLALAFGENRPVEHIAPEPGQSEEIVGIDDDVVEGNRHSSILLHGVRRAIDPVADGRRWVVRRRPETTCSGL
jgi:hypothetical protein